MTQPQRTTHHADSITTYLVIYLLLMALLVATVVVASFNLGPYNFLAAMAIAAIKANLVILFFMHVRHNSKLTWVFVAAGFLWLGVLITFTLTDYSTRGRPIPNTDSQITLQNSPAVQQPD
jgi:cytochrome c oxidase subunit 4